MNRRRITRQVLDGAAVLLNQVAGTPTTPYRKNADGSHVAQVGCFHISGAYGGFALHQMVSEGGAIRDVLYSGHVPARELFNRIMAYRYGLEGHCRP